MQQKNLVVIGNGMAGARFVEELILRGGTERYRVTMFGDEPYGNYNRILLSGVLAGTHQPTDIFLNPLAWYDDNDVRLHAGVRVLAIDRRTRTVLGSDGTVEPYDTLVIATGSRAFVPPIPGAGNPDGSLAGGVHVFRTLEDTETMVSRARLGGTAAVIGGGLLGLEAARGLMELGMDVHVVHLGDHLMDVQLDPKGGRILQRTLEAMGVRIHTGTATREVLREGRRVTGLQFADGARLACDMVVISAGIRPNLDLAAVAGLETRRGIVVGDDLRTSDPEIYSLGECAEHRGQTYGLVAPLWEQAAVLADRLSGRDPGAEYHGSRVATKLKVMGIELSVMGEQAARDDDDEEITYQEARGGVYKKLVVREGRLAGAILLGDASAAPRLVQLFDRDEPVPEARSELLFPGNGAGARSSAAELPDSAQICNCNGVSKKQLVEAVRGGCRTVKSLCETTRAGQGCGSCRGAVEEVLVGVAGEAAVDPSAHYYVPGVPLAKPELIHAIRERGLKSVSAVFRELAGGTEHAASKPGLASLLRTLWAGEYEDERDARFINDRVHANIQKDATFSVVPRIYGGVTTPAELRRIADVAERHEVPMVKLTGGQRIDLLGVPREKLPVVWKELGMPSGHAYAKGFRTCKTCVGTEFCRFGVGDSTGLGIAIERRFQGLETPHKIKAATTGCPRNCSEATTKDVGAVAIDGGRWELYVGGAAGSEVRKGDVLCVVDSHDEVILHMGRFLQYYRENAKYLERTWAFVERIGVAELRRLLVDDAEGLAAGLDARMDDSVAAYVDPWQEAEKPVHPTQFAEIMLGAPVLAEV